jgi:hypothetical protein
MLLHTLSLVLPVTGDSTNNGTQRRPLKKFIPNLTSLIVHVILKILTCVYLVLPGLGRFFAVQRADKPLGNISKPQFSDSGSEEQLISRSIKEDPLWQRLQHLETLVNDLVNKPTKIPQDKDDMLRESLSRIKSIEYDLQKTKKVNYPSLANISLNNIAPVQTSFLMLIVFCHVHL